MNNKVLINLFDEHNTHSLIAIDIYEPYKVIFLIEEKDIESYRLFEEKCRELFSNVLYEKYIIKNSVIKIFDKLIYNDVDSITINITGGRRIYSLELLQYAMQKGISVVYIDVLEKCLHSFGERKLCKQIEIKDLYIDEVALINGSKIIVDSSELSKNLKIVDISKRIYSNLEIWHKYKNKLYDKKIFIHNITESNVININFKILSKEEKDVLDVCLKYLQSLDMIKFEYKNELIRVSCLNHYIKGFIFKSGTWLEVLIDVIIKQIKEIDQVKNGVMFIWKNKDKIKNEIDIVAVKDSILICISCKDSDKYDEVALNELKIYSDRIGGENTKKILVATKEPIKKCVISRAKEMEINLLIIDRDINKLKKQLINILK